MLSGLGRIAEARAEVAACIAYAPGWRQYFVEMARNGLVPMTLDQVNALLP